MDLIDRYIHEVGRYLPAKNRSDIQQELRSLLNDALEDQAGPQPSEQEVAGILKKFGAPRQVAARYYPEGQYLIGPSLYPLFRMVLWIVVAALAGSQVVAWAVAYLIAGRGVDPLAAVAGLFSSLPAAGGWVVLTFYLLQRFDVHPEKPDEAWDPADLPQVNPEAELKPAERWVDLVITAVLLAALTLFPERIGVYLSPGGAFFGNPLLAQYLGWISLSLAISILVDIYLIWQGRWTTLTRLALLGADLFGIVVLTVLVQAHTAWLQAHGIANLAQGLQQLTQNLAAGGQSMVVWTFWMAFSIAWLVNVIQAAVQAARLAGSAVRGQKAVSLG